MNPNSSSMLLNNMESIDFHSTRNKSRLGKVDDGERNEIKFLSEQIDKINGLGNIIAKCGKELALPGQSRNYGYYKNKESIGRRTLEKYIGIFETHPDSYKIQNEIHTLKQAANSDVIWDEIVNIELYTRLNKNT
jgi:hypothetical protein